jgi:predicted nucleic acid-binding protein
MNYIADTHALLWWFTSSPKLGSQATEIFQKCEEGDIVVFLPSIVIAETLSIFDKKRVTFDFRKLLKKITHSDNYVIVPLDIPIIKK